MVSTDVRRLISAVLALATLVALPAGVARADNGMAFASAPISDDELAGTYGKFMAPGGIDLAMSVQSDTSVDGQLVLRSILTIDQGPASVQVFAPAPGTTGPIAPPATDADTRGGGATPGALSVMFDRRGATLTIQPVSVTTPSSPNVAVSTGGQTGSSASTANDGLMSIPVVPGSSVDTAGGTVTVAPSSGGARVDLAGLGLNVTHLMGGTNGTIVTNTIDNRTIDTVTTVSIDLRNADALALGTSLMRVDGVATAAAQALIR